MDRGAGGRLARSTMRSATSVRDSSHTSPNLGRVPVRRNFGRLAVRSATTPTRPRLSLILTASVRNRGDTQPVLRNARQLGKRLRSRLLVCKPRSLRSPVSVWRWNEWQLVQALVELDSQRLEVDTFAAVAAQRVAAEKAATKDA